VVKGHLRTGSPALNRCASFEVLPSGQTSAFTMMQQPLNGPHKEGSKDIPSQMLSEGGMS
jgi:hypothetical protein